MVDVIRSEFSAPGSLGDFRWMIEQPEFADCLFVFNDNDSQFRSHQQRLGTEHVCHAGGGNASIRPYQCVQPPRAMGIPTGDDGGYRALDAHAKSVIDEAIAYLGELLATGRYHRVVFSWDSARETLGTGIFDVAREVTDYIVERIELAAMSAP